MADLPHDEGLAYQVIERAGDNGVWMGTIRRDTSLAAPRLKKVLKSLQAKKLIKSFKSFRVGFPEILESPFLHRTNRSNFTEQS